MAHNHSVVATAIKAWRPVIGLEIHAQLNTRSKMFSMAAFNDDAAVNSSVSQFDMAAPGTLPVLNRAAVMLGLKAGFLLNCTIPPRSRFERKHYFYADMPAGYQITQQRNPVAHSGYFDFYSHSDDKKFTAYSKRLRISRIQLEVDSGKTLHDLPNNRSLIDLNRAGVGLIEIVTEPELSSALEGQCFAEQLLLMLAHNNICGGQMHRGQFRVDANISLSVNGSTELGVRTEVKNLNSLRSVYTAINYEIARQHEILSKGGIVVNETRTVDDEGRTVPMRDKEVETDYRFLPEPNLPSVVIHSEWLNNAQTSLSRKPDYLLYIEDYGMDPNRAITISKDSSLTKFLKVILHSCHVPVNEILLWLDELKLVCDKCNEYYPPTKDGFEDSFETVVNMHHKKQITKYTAIKLIRDELEGTAEGNPETVVKRGNLWRISSEEELAAVVRSVFEQQRITVEKALKNPKPKLLNKLRNEVIVAAGKRIDLQDAADVVQEMLKMLGEARKTK